jgi:mitogen-activated protein kinase 7
LISGLLDASSLNFWVVKFYFLDAIVNKCHLVHLDVHQLNLILNVLGTPPMESVMRIGSKRAQEYVRSLEKMPRIPFSKLYPNATPTGKHSFNPSSSIKLVGKNA